MARVIPLPPPPGRPATTAAPPPKHLAAIERRLHQQICSSHRFDDPAALALLAATMEAHERARRCREAIARDGETVTDRFGQIRAHPLLVPETHARAAFLAGMKALRLDMVGTEP